MRNIRARVFGFVAGAGSFLGGLLLIRMIDQRGCMGQPIGSCVKTSGIAIAPIEALHNTGVTPLHLICGFFALFFLLLLFYTTSAGADRSNPRVAFGEMLATGILVALVASALL